MTAQTLALTIHSLRGGGAERLMAQLANRWAGSGHRVHLITWDKGQGGYELDPRVVRIGLDLAQQSGGLISGVAANWKRIRALRTEFRRIEPTRIVSFCDQMNIVALQAARGLSIPVTIAEHSDPSKQKLSRLWEAFRRRTYPTARQIVALTPAIAEFMRPWCTGEMVVIPPAISPPEAPIPGTPKSDAAAIQGQQVDSSNRAAGRRLLYVGRLSEEKGIGLLEDVWKKVQSDLPDWRLSVIGDGPMRDHVRREFGKMQRVDVLGWRDDVWAEYRRGGIFVLPSRYEGFPVALLEAMSQGLACVTSDCSSAIRQLADGVRVCESRDAESFAKQIVGLANDNAARQSLGVAAAEIAGNYTWDCIGPKWDECIDG